MPSEREDKVVPYTISPKKTEYNNLKNQNIENQNLSKNVQKIARFCPDIYCVLKFDFQTLEIFNFQK